MKTEESNVSRFYEWLRKMNNIYLNDNERIVEAFRIVANN